MKRNRQDARGHRDHTRLEVLGRAAGDSTPVSGWTHDFYRYPARFSPVFARTAIQQFSRPGDLIVDPYMGGGTAVVEGMAIGRHVVGNDLNTLAAFIARAKTTRLTSTELTALRCWGTKTLPTLHYRLPGKHLAALVQKTKTANLSLYRARYIKKVLAAALATLPGLPTTNARRFAKCVLLRTAQWALDGRRQHTPLDEFRNRLVSETEYMLAAIQEFTSHVRNTGGRATILNVDARVLDRTRPFMECGKRASLVITSPPYPGVHVLYHRWQVDGRRETPAPYWITGCNDGRGASFYNFGARRNAAAEDYFRMSLETLLSIRETVSRHAYFIQMVAFSQPGEQLPRYLENMHLAGFAELSGSRERLWRGVPNRKWHATLRGDTNSAREVVLIHYAV